MHPYTMFNEQKKIKVQEDLNRIKLDLQLLSKDLENNIRKSSLPQGGSEWSFMHEVLSKLLSIAGNVRISSNDSNGMVYAYQQPLAYNINPYGPIVYADLAQSDARYCEPL